MTEADHHERRLEALGGFVERTSRRVDDLDQRVAALTQTDTRLAADLAALAADLAAERPVVRSWLLATDPDQARTDLTDLIDWLGRVYLHYPRSVLPSCWLWHPAAVEELWWLRQAHQEAYDGPQASYTRAADWHDRQRPQVAERLTRVLGGCELSLHTQPAEPPAVPLAEAAARVVQAWTSTRSTPTPTAVDLAEAERHDQAQHRSRRR